MRALIFGASAGLGRSLARELAAAGYDLTLLARDKRDLMAEAAHCMTVYGIEADWIAADAADPPRMAVCIEEYLRAKGMRFRVLAFTVGGACDPDDLTSDPSVIQETVNANLSSVMSAARLLLPHLERDEKNTVLGFGSIAASRGRSHNIAYAAAKRGLESFFESLRHATAAAGTVVQFYQLGYVATQQSYGKKLHLPAADPNSLAKHIVRCLGVDFGSRYLPRYWAVIVLCLRLLPWILFKRLRL